MTGAPHGENDEVVVFRDQSGRREWRWHRVDTGNGQIVAISGQGYVDRSYAAAAAAVYCPGIPLLIDDDEGER